MKRILGFEEGAFFVMIDILLLVMKLNSSKPVMLKKVGYFLVMILNINKAFIGTRSFFTNIFIIVFRF